MGVFYFYSCLPADRMSMHTTAFLVRPVQTVPSAITHLYQVDTAKCSARKLALHAKHSGSASVIRSCSVSQGCRLNKNNGYNMCLFCIKC